MIKNYTNLSPSKEMEARSIGISGVVSLAQGAPSFDTPAGIKRRVIEAIRSTKLARSSFPAGLLELREAIEHNLAEQNIFYDFENEIIATAGSAEAISATLIALLGPGDEVLIPNPTHTLYQKATKNARGVPVFVDLDEDNNWEFNIDDFEDKITSKTKAILFCNPNSPTGAVYGREQIINLLELAERHNLYIIADEVYKDFIYDDVDFLSVGKLTSFRKRIIYIFSFSRSYAMASWRIAYLAADKKIAQKILAVHSSLVSCAPVISQWGALAALEMAQKDLEIFYRKHLEQREATCDYLDKLSEWLPYFKPKAAHFVFPKLSKKLVDHLKKDKEIVLKYKLGRERENSNSWWLALKLLYEAKVAVVPGIAFGPKGDNHIRLCFGRSGKNVGIAMERIKIFLENF